MVITVRHDDHQKVKGCLPRYDSWGFVSCLMRSDNELMCSGSAVHIMATWQIMASGVNAPLVWLFGFPAGFQFLVFGF